MLGKQEMTFLFPGKFQMDVGDGNLNILWGGGGGGGGFKAFRLFY
jgi:hypothetical protein